MNRKNDDMLTAWLRAEAEADDDRAEAAFGALFATVDRLAPRHGFTERVLVAIQPAAAPASVIWTWGGRAVLAAAMALAALMAGLLPAARWLPIEVPRVGRLVDGFASAMIGLADWLTAGLAVWRFFAVVGRGLGVAVTTPEVAAAVLLTTSVGAMALYGLHRMLVFERRAWS